MYFHLISAVEPAGFTRIFSCYTHLFPDLKMTGVLRNIPLAVITLTDYTDSSRTFLVPKELCLIESVHEKY